MVGEISGQHQNKGAAIRVENFVPQEVTARGRSGFSWFQDNGRYVDWQRS
jgi:hypothetical protein